MEIFIIVKNIELIKEKFRQFCRSLPKYRGIYFICLGLLAVVLWEYGVSNTDDECMVAKSNSVMAEETKGEGKMLFPVDKQEVVLKNPFSLEHETFNTKKDSIQDNPKVDRFSNREIAVVKNTVSEKQEKSIKQKNNTYKVKAILQFGRVNTVLVEKDQKSYRLEQDKWVDNMKLVEVKAQSVVIQLASGAFIECKLNKEYEFGV